MQSALSRRSPVQALRCDFAGAKPVSDPDAADGRRLTRRDVPDRLAAARDAGPRIDLGDRRGLREAVRRRQRRTTRPTSG
jgi:hypothetical protein